MNLSTILQYFTFSFDTVLTIAAIFIAVWIYYKQKIKQEKNALIKEISSHLEQMHKLAMDSLTATAIERICAEYSSHKIITEICINRLRNYRSNDDNRFYDELDVYYEKWISKIEKYTRIRSLQDKHSCSMVIKPTKPMNDKMLLAIHSDYGHLITSLHHCYGIKTMP